MSLCINPVCPKLDHHENEQNRFCQSCGSQMELLGRYRVTRLLSDKTGFSKVYDAYEQDTPKILKVLKQELSSDVKAVELFQHEVTVLKKFNHPGIPQADTYFQYQTRNGMMLHCIAIAKIDGFSLEQWLKQQNYFIYQAQAIAWLRQLAEILDVVHGKQYLHQDIKPSNIMIRSPIATHRQGGWGELVLIDFGIAREITQPHLGQINNSTAIISSGYSPPEQMNSQAVPQSDFFALGRTLMFLLTRCHPLDMYDVQHNLWHWRNYATHISPLLLDIIDWLAAPEVEKRPVNAQEILQRLAEVETQLTETQDKVVDLAISSKTDNSIPITIKTLQSKQQLEKVPLLEMFTAFLISLGTLTTVFLWTQASFKASSPDGNTARTITVNNGQAPQRKGKIDYFTYEEGRDSQGRIAKFNIAVLSVEYKWLVDSTFQVKHNDEIISVELLNLNIEQENIQKLMGNANEIISVGLASCSGDTAIAERIALERSKQTQILAKTLFSNISSPKEYRLLNLGQFQNNNCQNHQDLTAHQRSVIIIGVEKQSEDVILDEALRNRLEKKPFADFRLEDYSLGAAEKFKTLSSNF
ncbi:MAG: serine/threonine protein kinase [Desmonostoc vinosum HA7617-LM4]|jgi:serine/threonine protein kinase|nr:serine/threonine protein kinase [Desmonostoc vinosum HA7617-LM4]